MTKGLFFIGTDGSGEWINRCKIRWPLEDLEEIKGYKGDYPNTDHSLEHREKYHTDVLTQHANTKDAKWIGEWWVTFDPDLLKERQGCPPDSRATSNRMNDFLTRVHYPPEDEFIGGVLHAAKQLAPDSRWLQNGLEWPDIQPIPDLADSKPERQYLIETVFAHHFDPEPPHTSVGGRWYRAAMQTAYVRRTLGQAIRSYV